MPSKTMPLSFYLLVLPLVGLLLVALAPPALAQGAPDVLNYQGVLRDGEGNPRNGDFDMVFRFFDEREGGNEILVDEHVSNGSRPINVNVGLFTVALGTGLVSDGSASLPRDPYTSLAQVFREFPDVFMQIEIGSGSPEVLSPRVRILSAPYALNAENAVSLGGRLSSEYLNTSTVPQSKVGDLAVKNLTINDDSLNFGIGSRIESGASGDLTLRPASGITRFANDGNEVAASIDPAGNLTIGSSSSTDNDWIKFDTSEYLTWDDTQIRFEFSEGLAIAGSLQTGTNADEPLPFSKIGGGDQFVVSTISTSNDLLVTDDLQVGDSGYFSKSIIVGDVVPNDPDQVFSSFGFGTADSDAISDTNDVYVSDDLEVDGTIYASSIVGGLTARTRSDGDVESIIDNDDDDTNREFRWFHHGTLFIGEQLAELRENGNFRIRGTLSQNVSFDVAESFLAIGQLEPGTVVAVDESRPDAVRRSRGSDDAVIGVISTQPGVLLGSAPFEVETLGEVWGEDVLQTFWKSEPQLREEVLLESPSMRDELGSLAVLLKDDADSEDAAQAEIRRKEIEVLIEGRALELFCEDHLVPVALSGRIPVKVDASYGAIRRGDPLAASPTPGMAMRAGEGMATLGLALEDFAEGRGTVMTLIDRGAASASSGAPLEASPVVSNPDLEAAIQATPAEVAPSMSLVATASPGSPALHVDADGLVHADAGRSSHALDSVEIFPVHADVGAGDVLVVGEDGTLGLATRARDPLVVGVVAPASSLRGGTDLKSFAGKSPELMERILDAANASDTERAALWASVAGRYESEHVAIAVGGVVSVKVDAGYGAIRPGDLLTSSPTPGHAMVSIDRETGTIIGKALEAHESGQGVVRMLVMSR